MFFFKKIMRVCVRVSVPENIFARKEITTIVLQASKPVSYVLSATSIDWNYWNDFGNTFHLYPPQSQLLSIYRYKTIFVWVISFSLTSLQYILSSWKKSVTWSFEMVSSDQIIKNIVSNLEDSRSHFFSDLDAEFDDSTRKVLDLIEVRRVTIFIQTVL